MSRSLRAVKVAGWTLLAVGIASAIGFSVYGCQRGMDRDAAAENQRVVSFLQGQHPLRKIVEWTDRSAHVNGGFFLFLGSISADSKETGKIRFAWRMSDSIYAMSTMPIDRIRVRIDDRAVVPTIAFTWADYRPYRYYEPQDMIDNYVVHATVTVRDTDWPVRIKMPMNE